MKTAGYSGAPAQKSAAQLLMTGYNAHDDADLYGTLHFFQNTMWYADTDTDSQETESADSDVDVPYQL